MKKHTLEKIKKKFPDYKDYIEILKRIKFETEDDTNYITFKHEDRYINSDVEEVLIPKFIPKEGINPSTYQEKCTEFLKTLPDFLNFLIKQL